MGFNFIITNIRYLTTYIDFDIVLQIINQLYAKFKITQGIT